MMELHMIGDYILLVFVIDVNHVGFIRTFILMQCFFNYQG
jgi:hypothetical protein